MIAQSHVIPILTGALGLENPPLTDKVLFILQVGSICLLNMKKSAIPLWPASERNSISKRCVLCHTHGPQPTPLPLCFHLSKKKLQ